MSQASKGYPYIPEDEEGEQEAEARNDEEEVVKETCELYLFALRDVMKQAKIKILILINLHFLSFDSRSFRSKSSFEVEVARSIIGFNRERG